MRPILDWIFIIGSGVGVPFVFALVALARRRTRKTLTIPPARVSKQTRAQKPPREEKRELSRRGGHTVGVTIDCYAGQINGWVIDRSVRGIGIGTDVALAPGEIIKVRPASAGPSVAAEKAEVRHCTPKGIEFQIGLEFFRTPGSEFLIHLG